MGKRSIVVGLVLSASLAMAQVAPVRSSGQSLYLPIYSHLWHGDLNPQKQPVKTLVSVSVSIRNTDPTRSIRVLSARYFDTQGNSIRDYVTAPLTIGPLGTHELFVPRSDDTGGSGANFVIRWSADKPASPPQVAALHVNLPVGRSLAFTTTAVVMPEE